MVKSWRISLCSWSYLSSSSGSGSGNGSIEKKKEKKKSSFTKKNTKAKNTKKLHAYVLSSSMVYYALASSLPVILFMMHS